MWTEEKIREVLERKEKLLKELDVVVHDNGVWFRGDKFMDAPDQAAAVAQELGEQRAQRKKIENQIEVLKCILDIK